MADDIPLPDVIEEPSFSISENIIVSTPPPFLGLPAGTQLQSRSVTIGNETFTIPVGLLFPENHEPKDARIEFVKAILAEREEQRQIESSILPK